jgi:hypothetical protein
LINDNTAQNLAVVTTRRCRQKKRNKILLQKNASNIKYQNKLTPPRQIPSPMSPLEAPLNSVQETMFQHDLTHNRLIDGWVGVEG